MADVSFRLHITNGISHLVIEIAIQPTSFGSTAAITSFLMSKGQHWSSYLVDLDGYRARCYRLERLDPDGEWRPIRLYVPNTLPMSARADEEISPTTDYRRQRMWPT